MKKIYLLLLLATTALSAQTSYKNDDIAAAASNQYETLLTNVKYGLNDASVQALLSDMNFIESDRKVNPVGTVGNFTKRYELQNAKGVYLYVKFTGKPQAKGTLPLTTKFELYGDAQSVVKFYVNFWGQQLDFSNVKSGEVVSTRFLSDVATITSQNANTAKVTVVTTKDR